MDAEWPSEDAKPFLPSFPPLPPPEPWATKISYDRGSLDLEYMAQKWDYDRKAAALAESILRERLALVSSLYGPGNMVCWLCILGSVFIGWTLNRKCHSKDIISNDFIAALVIPVVASGHAIYRLVFATLHPPSNPTEAIQFVAAIEAPLNVCETFTVVALAFSILAAFRKHRKQSLCVLAVGLLCFSIESIIFLYAPETGVELSNFSRPYLFNFAEMMICAFVFLGVSMLFLAVAVALRRAQRWPLETLLEPSETRQEARLPLVAAVLRILDLLLWLLPFAFIIFIFPLETLGAIGVFGIPALMVSLDWFSRISFFIPRTNNSILELDQAVALAMGIFSLLFSLRDAYESRNTNVESQSAPVELTNIDTRRTTLRHS
jgi:hypothetical protein